MPGVATGVEKFEGSSEVKIVAVEGDKMYRAFRTDIRLAVKPSNMSANSKMVTEEDTDL